MSSIELPEDYSQPARVTVAQTLLRITLGLILIGHGASRMVGLEAWQDELAERFSLLEPAAFAYTMVAIELLGGVLLMFGWLTRVGAFALFCSVAGSVALEVVRLPQGGHVLDHTVFELPLVLAVGALFFLLAGGGPGSLDVVLRDRARRKAIENDNIWLKHPYVSEGESGEYDYANDTYRRRVVERR
jgi:putative oxidoreductase